MVDTNTKEYSFYELISENDIVIEIPKVQRDYVQGRDNEHAKMVLGQLLEDIKETLMQDKEALQLQFVYGKEMDRHFIPIDGQQRLTTLFLLHVYAFRNDKSKDAILKRFTYETRATSRDCIERLVENRKAIFAEKEDAEKVSLKEIITDAPWFNPLAVYDPTVCAMMNALEMIYEKFCDCENLAEKLMDCENKKVVFHFLNMDKLGMEDSLYIKLNARGKQLTKFENFKASLFKKLENIKEYTLVEKNDILAKFDNTWTDIFWQCTKDDMKKVSFDNVFESFFKVILSNLGILDGININILNIDLPEVGEKINKDFFDTLMYLLDYLADENNKQALHEYKEIKDRTIQILTKEYTYEDRVLFHMIVCFIREVKGDVLNNLEEYRRWTRVFKNLIYNTTIDKEELRERAIESINEVSGHWNDLYQYMQENGIIHFFDKLQKEEEIEKIKIILEEEKSSQKVFATAIHKAEEHPYFQGQIRSALYRAYDVKDGTYNVDKFIEYWEKIEFLFDEKKPKDGEKLSRALLSYGDYRMDVSAYKTLCVDSVNDSAKTPSMKSLFSVINSVEMASSYTIVTQLLDDLRIRNNADKDNELDRIIDTNKSSISQDEWRWCLVNYDKYKKLFDFMGKRRMRNDYGEELLIRNTSASGLNPNIFLMVVGLEIRRDITDPYYYPERGAAVEHRFYFRDTKGKCIYLVQKDKKIQIKYCYENNLNDAGLIKEFSGANMIDETISYCRDCISGKVVIEG